MDDSIKYGKQDLDISSLTINEDIIYYNHCCCNNHCDSPKGELYVLIFKEWSAIRKINDQFFIIEKKTADIAQN